MTPQALLDLQLNDSAIDLIRHRLPRLPDVVAGHDAATAVRTWEQRASSLRQRIAALEAAIAASESANATISAQRGRLEQQLKTVIAPREAEALMHEISMLNSRRSALDDDELDAMEQLAAAEADLADHTAAEADLRTSAESAAVRAAEATAASRAELADKEAMGVTMRAALGPAMVARYEAMRAQHNGVGVAKLNGARCEGCQLELSRGEVDEFKRLPSDEMPECPNCGRLLVR